MTGHAFDIIKADDTVADMKPLTVAGIRAMKKQLMGSAVLPHAHFFSTPFVPNDFFATLLDDPGVSVMSARRLDRALVYYLKHRGADGLHITGVRGQMEHRDLVAFPL